MPGTISCITPVFETLVGVDANLLAKSLTATFSIINGLRFDLNSSYLLLSIYAWLCYFLSCDYLVVGLFPRFDVLRPWEKVWVFEN